MKPSPVSPPAATRRQPWLLTLLGILALVALIFGLFVPPPPPPGHLGPGNLPVAVSSETVAIYFSQSHGSRVVLRPVKRSVPPQLEKNSPDQPKDQTLIAFSLLELLQGPSDEESAQGLYSEIPKGTRLLRLTSGPQRVDLNVSRQFVSGGGSNSMAQRLAELKTTVFEAQKHAGASKKPVYLAVEGQPLKLLGGEGIIVDEPLTPTEP